MEIAFIVGDAPLSPSQVSFPGGSCQELSELDASFAPSLHEDRMYVLSETLQGIIRVDVVR